jgi:Ca2+-transporting ATPase
VEGLYRSESLKYFLEARLAEHTGIQDVSASHLTGNILVSFNSDNTLETVAALIAQCTAEHERASVDPVLVKAIPENPGNGVRTAGKASHYKADTAPLKTSLTVSQATPSPRVQGIATSVSHRQDGQTFSWHLMSTEATLVALHASQTGLSSAEVRERLRTYGPNLLPESEPRSALEILFDQVNSLPVGLLTVAAGVSIVTGGLVDAAVIMGVVAINATIGYFTESQSEQTIRSLKSLVHPSAVVVRDGVPKEVRAEEVVPGDILVLKPGSYIAADSRLLESQRLSVDESALTGESVPVNKIAATLTSLDLPLADRLNMLYRGTLVTGGQGLAVVVATGRATEIGHIQLLAEEAEAPQTPMERQLDQMGTQLVFISGGVCGLVFLVGLAQGYGFLEMLKTSISLAVAAVPEGLPTVATTTLALGIATMRKHNVLIRRLDAVETLGCVQTICLDKTGTLTLNRMTTVAAFTGMRRLQMEGETFTVEEERIAPLGCEEFVRLAQVGVLCSEVEIEPKDGAFVLRGSPTENALIHMAMDAGMDVCALRTDYPVQQVTLRSENRNFMSTVHRVVTDPTGKTPPTSLLAVKGSPVEMLAMCAWHIRDGVRVPLTESDRLAIETENERMAGQALRVLGFAYRHSDENRKAEEQIEGLTWLGLVGMADPVRPGVRKVIEGFHHAGIDTVMITGDQSPTAYAIGKELALSRNGHLEILDSTHLTNIAPEVMTALSEKVQVFARVSPAHKLQIVQALQRGGKVVAMTGDGINDGPALKAANIGIAMGHTGTDVAREVADVVLEDDNLETMVIAVSQGRTIYNNIRKSVHFLLATNLSEIIVTATAITAGLGHPLTAMQLLWINLISDIAPGLALALEPPEPDVLNQPPRNPEEPIIKPSDFRRVGVESAALSAGALGSYGYGLMRYGMGPQASTLAFTSLTTGQLLHAITSRSETHSVFSRTSLPPNPYLSAALIGSFGLQALALTVPGLQSLLGVTPISLIDGAVIGASAVLPFVFNEATKR